MEPSPNEINCDEACVNGCILGEKCPHRAYLADVSKFINDTPMDKIIAIAEESVQKRFIQSLERERMQLPHQPE
ncbi:hypothetical protein L3556_05000 [Candidatus Synechococcus calcipolaris G9]|uniref:4Fe-4S ferredoxin-type domain-containing protein n=1 Tax=Candidatus Synechococcus calcipolaris G9 TaxID=1497997 RepID=A0ABT6EWZ8_9SYNE|nr:hypothetical protein [Candidatus Synechococcus calcipolaris]MDG2990296.1 hypothetical protein [Candidatus Synechococcus calcipolaris G9]